MFFPSENASADKREKETMKIFMRQQWKTFLKSRHVSVFFTFRNVSCKTFNMKPTENICFLSLFIFFNDVIRTSQGKSEREENKLLWKAFRSIFSTWRKTTEIFYEKSARHDSWQNKIWGKFPFFFCFVLKYLNEEWFSCWGTKHLHENSFELQTFSCFLFE